MSDLEVVKPDSDGVVRPMGVAERQSMLPAVSTIAGELVLSTLDEIERVATACAASGYYKDVRDASQAVVKMLAGREMGIGPVRALAEIHIVEGKPTAAATAIAANVKKSGRYDYRVRERSNERCEIEFFERGESVGSVEWTLEDAKRAGLANKQNWQRYPRAMLFARAMTEGVRSFCPDAAGGVVYTAEELGAALADDGVTPIDVTPTRRPSAPSEKPAKKSAKKSVSKSADKPASVDDYDPPIAKSATALETIQQAVRARLELCGVDPENWPGVAKSCCAAIGFTGASDTPSSKLGDLLSAVESWTPPGEEPPTIDAEQEARLRAKATELFGAGAGDATLVAVVKKLGAPTVSDLWMHLIGRAEADLAKIAMARGEAF